MPPIEEYLEQADELAQEVVNEYAKILNAGHAGSLADDFIVVYEKARFYRNARRDADNLREFGTLTEPDTAEEKATRQAFVDTYKTFREARQLA